ncbi:homoserine O-acetyltransferase/O-succinyltransferase family protein [Agrilactobacillus fermenti]|uniref:homoserine O-acetyltransferase/O-succinyltransferase family protein n=1 Tax=Agrilactobacillus fermenti TaxID=2586909 RepID=UPI001E5AC696|nr:homoserine O-succinyltransferase [Agrilactobacillus fermenti]MCD2256732.1 homoserine O-succinyltransferase [Agrilactobacillus fermenti]
MSKRTLQIGVLNVMHDKAATKFDLTQALSHFEIPVQLHFYYPTLHYRGRSVPNDVKQLLQPLDLKAVARLDAFIITGAPLETIDFAAITYIQEIRELLQVLQQLPNRLYLCWGGMVALHELYGIHKHNLPHKLFGVYPHHIVTPSPLLAGLQEGFLAPHARYAEMSPSEIEQQPQLKLRAVSKQGQLLLVENHDASEVFEFAHLEYGQKGLLAEYQRETAAHPERTYRKPVHYFKDPDHLSGPQFLWRDTQRHFFYNWLKLVQGNVGR